MANTSLRIGGDNWAVKEDNLLGYNVIQNKYVPIEMDVVRATTATRVNENGLIEVVPRNLASYSEQFDNASWVKERITITANATTAPNGTLTADKIVEDTTTNSHRARQNTISEQGVQYTLSYYLKASERTKARIIVGGLNAFANFDLSNGTIIGTPTLCTASIIDANNGWYRCSITYTQTSATSTTQLHLAATLNAADDFSYLGDGVSGIFIWGAQLEQGTLTDYFPTTDRLNIPRIDYSSGTASLLIEPQRTNLLLRSEEFDNAWWVKTASSITANYANSPDGTQNADRFVGNGTSGQHILRHTYIGVSALTNYTYSFYIKADGISKVGFFEAGQTAQQGSFNIATKSVIYISNNSSIKIEDSINGFLRVSITTLTGSNGVLGLELFLLDSSYISQNPRTYSSNVSSSEGIIIYGAQLEAGSYDTSYIPTVASAVTRNADVISKTGISGLIGQTEGTVFFQFDNRLLASYPNEYTFQILGSGGHQLWLRKESGSPFFTTRLIVSSSTIWTFSGIPIPNGNTKIAISYKTGDSAIYLNGTQFGSTNTSAFSGNSFTDFYFNLQGIANPELILNQAILYKTRLSNDELAQLTTL